MATAAFGAEIKRLYWSAVELNKGKMEKKDGK